MSDLSNYPTLQGRASHERDGPRLPDANATERRLFVQYSIASVLAEADSLDSASSGILRAICEGLGWDLGQLWTEESSAACLVLRDSVGAFDFGAPSFVTQSRQRTFDNEIGLPGRVWASGQPQWLTDLATELNLPRGPAAEADGLQSGFGFPIKFGDHVLGVMEFFSVVRKEPDADLLQAVDSLGHQIGQFIERTRVEAVLRDSQERMQLAMEAVAMGAWEWDVRSGVIHWTESMERMHGILPGSFDGTFESFLALVHPDDRDAVAVDAERSLDGDSHETEYRIIRPDGEVRWIYGKGQAKHDLSGQPVIMCGICMDITERKAAADRERFLSDASTVLSSSLDYDTVLERLARLIVGTMADWCAIDMSEGGTIRRVVLAHADPAKSDVARQLQTYSPDPAGIAPLQAILERGQPLLFRDLNPALLSEESALDRSQYPLLRELGMRSVMVVPLIARGALLGAITFVSTDMNRQYSETELSFAKDLASRAALAVDNARLYTESQQAQEQLRKANETKDEFLGLVSHELRTPITTIYGGARLLRLRGSALDETSRAEVLRDIANETERLHRIVENLLVLARVEVGPDTAREPILLQRVIESVLRSFRERTPLRSVECHIAVGLRPVAAELTSVEQVMRNLLSNAEKYSPPASDIEVCVDAEGDEAIVRVLDRGPGITPAETETVFDRFYRSAGTKGKAGIGLGLTVCKRLVEAQSGRIWALPREGGGLEIGFSVPFAEEV